MTVLSKKQMSEEDIKLNYITPAIQKGWSGHITMETKITETNTAIQEVYDAQTALNDKMKELEEQCSALQKIANKWVVHA